MSREACPSNRAGAFPLRVVTIEGQPMIPLRALLKATGHRPYFIRGGLLTVDGVRRFLQRSDKPMAPELLKQIEGLCFDGPEHVTKTCVQ